MTDSANIKMIFGSVVKELRTAKGLTQEKLAEHLGIQAQTIARIETARSFVSSELLASLCDFFNVEPSIFFSKRAKNYGTEDLNYINQIKRLLPEFENSKLKEIYNILLAMKKS